MDSQSQLTASFRSLSEFWLSYVWIYCPWVTCSLGILSLSAYTSTQKASISSRLQLEGVKVLLQWKVCTLRRVLFLLVLRGSILHWDTQWNRQHPVLTLWPTFLAQSFCLLSHARASQSLDGLTSLGFFLNVIAMERAAGWGGWKHWWFPSM